MNYKDSISIFRNKAHIEARKRKEDELKLTNNEIMFLLSEAQQKLSNKYQIFERSATVDFVAGQSIYSMGSGASNLPTDFLDLRYIKVPFSPPYNLEEISKGEMDTIEKVSGLPSKYCLYNTGGQKVLELDVNPEYSYDVSLYPEYRLNLVYIARVGLFDSTAGTSASISFSDWDETAEDYGGSWKLPEDWHSLIINLALSEIYPQMYEGVSIEAERLFKSQFPIRTIRLKYKLGMFD